MADKKFIPDSDSDFALMARNFALPIARDPARYFLSADDAQKITSAVGGFRDALVIATRPGTRTKIAIMAKDVARSEAERTVRKYANLSRANDRVSQVNKKLIAVRERPRRLRRRMCPKRPPHLRYRPSASGSADVHLLEFREAFAARSRAKPFGAARLELFVGLIAPGQPVPESPAPPGAWYLRSFTTNPIRVKFPVSQEPMLVVYWGRWADATGDVGPWSATVPARVEGWCAPAPAPGICAPGKTGSGAVSGTELKVAA